MTEALRISPTETRERLRAQTPALLVCAYDDEERCASMRIPGSITLRELDGQLPFVSPDQEIIFYCA